MTAALLREPRLAACASSVAIERRISIEHQLTTYSFGSLNSHDRLVLERELAEAWASGYSQALRER